MIKKAKMKSAQKKDSTRKHSKQAEKDEGAKEIINVNAGNVSSNWKTLQQVRGSCVYKFLPVSLHL
jgi:hypothetical protein